MNGIQNKMQTNPDAWKSGQNDLPRIHFSSESNTEIRAKTVVYIRLFVCLDKCKFQFEWDMARRHPKVALKWCRLRLLCDFNSNRDEIFFCVILIER